jgi:Zn-dependent peptidase ImmA (M78 family)/transcriptional regulator with XRE-family HTH domain
MTKRVNPEMVRLARESRGFTQSEVAEGTQVHQGVISRLELGTADVLPEKLQLIAEFLHYPISFFYQDEVYSGLGISVVFYRKRASTLIKHMRRLEAAVNVRRIHAKALMRDMSLGIRNEFSTLDIDEMAGDAAAVAQMVRASWKVQPGPINNLIALIESAGAVVFRFPFGTRDIDALSVWPDSSPPIFLLNSEADADRARFSLAHELGHMVMHRRVSETIEDEADQFASEFLMPKKDIQQDLFGMTLERASSLKPYWRVSMAAIVRRSHDLGCMSDERYSSLFSYMSRLGFRRREPNPIAHEEPRLVPKLVQAHFQQLRFTRYDLSRLLHIHEDELEQMYLTPPSGLRLAL